MIYSPREKYDYILGVANIFLGLGTILLVIHLLAPLFGGKLLINAVIIYSSYIGFSLCLKYEAQRIRKQEKKHFKSHLPLLAYGIFCMGIWFPYPYNIGAILFFLISTFILHKIEKQGINSKTTS